MKSSIKRIIYPIISLLIKTFFKNVIVHKKYRDFNLVLFYERLKHLTFFMEKHITYEFNIQSKLKGMIKPGFLVFDIGSNIGQYALPFSVLTGNQGKVICFEPDSCNFAFLTFNAMMNHCHNIVTNKCGLGEKTGSAVFYNDTKTGGRRGSFKKDAVGDTIGGEENVILSTYDTEVKKFGIPDFVKIDVEGFETEIILGMKKPDEKTLFLIELRTATRKAVYDFFISNEFKCVQLDFEQIKIIEKLEDISDFGNFLFYKKTFINNN
jgi:FkbM family methyltransferase